MKKVRIDTLDAIVSLIYILIWQIWESEDIAWDTREWKIVVWRSRANARARAREDDCIVKFNHAAQAHWLMIWRFPSHFFFPFWIVLMNDCVRSTQSGAQSLSLSPTQRSDSKADGCSSASKMNDLKLNIYNTTSLNWWIGESRASERKRSFSIQLLYSIFIRSFSVC